MVAPETVTTTRYHVFTESAGPLICTFVNACSLIAIKLFGLAESTAMRTPSPAPVSRQSTMPAFCPLTLPVMNQQARDKLSADLIGLAALAYPPPPVAMLYSPGTLIPDFHEALFRVAVYNPFTRS